MVSQSWNATVGLATPGRQKRQTRFIGHYPGYRAAKQKANQGVVRQIQRRSQSTAGQTFSPAPQAPSSSTVVFDGPGESDTPYIPPDSQIAAGPNDVVVVINSLIGIYDKTGLQVGGFQQLSSFFSGLGVTGEIFDPRIIYDQTDNRFILSVADVDQTGFTQGHVLLAVSATSDPTGAWHKYALNFMGRNPSNTSSTFPDFPTLGLSSSAVYISTGQFVLNSACMANDTCSFSDTWIKTIGLPALLAGSSTLNITAFDNVTAAAGYPAFSIEPAVTYGSAPGEFLVAAGFTTDPGTTLNVFEINTSGTPTLSTMDLTVPNFSVPPDATQPGTGFQIATNDFRLLNAVWFNNSLWCGQNVEHVQQTNGPSAAARWYEIAATSLSTLSLAQTGDVTGSGDAYFPSLTVKANGDIGMVFTTSGAAQFASAAYTGRASSDPPNTMRTFSIYRAGTDDYVDFATRWGDYSGISPDPGGSSFWMIAEYAGSPNPHFGTAVAQAASVPILGLSTTAINFGPETINVPSVPLPVTITNSSTSSVTLGSATLSGSDAPAFAISSDGCSNVTLAAGETCTLSLTFTPASMGSKSALLQINSNPAGLPQEVYLSGQGAEATSSLSVSPSTLTFPSTAVGSASAPLTEQVTNIGTSAIDLEINEPVNGFTDKNNCPSSLGAGKSCDIEVTFRPTHAISYIAYLGITYSGFPTGVPHPSIPLSGTGFDAPGVTLCPVSVTFGNQTVGTTSSPQAVTLNNSGTSSLTVSAVDVSGDFAQTGTCGTLPATVPPGTGCTISVTFSPKSAGTRTGTLTFTDNATGSPQAAQLTGTGVTSSGQLVVPFQELQKSAGGRLQTAQVSSAVRRSALRALRSSRLAAARYGRLPLSFEANAGQTNPAVEFLSRGAGYTMFLTDRGAVLKLTGGNPRDRSLRTGNPLRSKGPDGSSGTGVVRMTLEGANARARVSGIDELPGKVNYLIGNDPSKWKTNVPLYAKVRYHDVYPGTDLVYYGNQHRLEYDFVLAPGADPNAIRFKVETPSATAALAPKAAPLKIAANGDLVIPTATGEVRFRKPVVYQPSKPAGRDSAAGESGLPGTSMRRSYRDGSFVLAGSRRNGYEVAFRLASYDPSRPLVIDPVLSYSTYLGGGGQDAANAIAVDAAGSAYVAGTTASADFPVANPLQTKINRTFPNDADAFITKLSPDGTSLVYSTFLGGTRSELADAIAVDGQGNVYVGGETRSSDFPITKGAFQTISKGGPEGEDGFLVKINAAGSILVYSTYFGGSGDELVTALALDSSDDAYIAGVTDSPDLTTTPGAPQTAYGGATTLSCTQEPGPPTSCGDAFVAEMNPLGAALVYSTYLGGNADDYASGIAVDSTGSAYVTGTTNSLNFPATPGAYQTWLPPSSSSAFITKIEPLGTGLAYSTYLGPNGGSAPFGVQAKAIGIDARGDAYVTGTTNAANFPKVNPIQTGRPVFGTGNRAFVTKLHPAGCGLIYSTPFGGFQYSTGTGIAVDSAGDAYVTGWTGDTDFPVVNPFQASYRQVPSGGAIHTQAFVSELAPTGSSFLYSSYLGGTTTDLPTGYGGGDVGLAIAVDAAGNAYVAGKTDSTDFPVVNGADSAYRGSTDGFVTKVAPTVVPSITLTPSALIFPDTALGTTSAPLSVTVTDTTANPVNISSITGQPGNTAFAIAGNSCTGTLQPNASCTFSLTFAPTNNGIDWAVATVNDNAFAGPHSVPLYGTGVTAPTIALGITGNSLDLGGTPIGTKSIVSTVVVENSGSQSLTISKIAVTGEFTQTNNCTSTLASEQTCTINLTFAPTTAGTKTGTLTITGNASNSPKTLSLTGVGQDFSVGDTPGVSSSATVAAGQAATYNVTVSASTGFNQAVNLACSGLPAHATCSFNPTGVTLNGTQPSTSKVSVTTTARAEVPGAYRFEGPGGFAGRALPFGLLALLAALMMGFIAAGGFVPAAGRNRRVWVGISAILLLALLYTTCGGGGGSFSGGGSTSQQSGTPAGTYTLTVTGTSGSLTHSTAFTLTVQ